ncbi:MAG: FKBP-type peptidyl-prolyl cis-trans isomerase 2 [Candidatus Methanohalarchaeum thermophilum]|uniref:Peptidyl-prolyl cis-trans isomerase n=1 Tax=Methanohalarchaeum thermophilum TaxID=1903181 RepID=A0A1Q6DXQ9_METT1|nr:MAG: FKBP-type peptidyl-prolyl cis-trans isomerase 2 [Candidatus Methanohalarchaeum thermophilum]
MKEGDFVRLNYTGKLEDGTVFDTTVREVAEEQGIEQERDYGPKTIIVGAGHVVEGLEEDIEEAEVGEDMEVEVEPEKGFGDYDEDKIRAFPKREFKNKHDDEPRKGKRVNIGGKPGTIISTVGGRVRVDFNHPLAGENLLYEYKVEEVIEKIDEKIKALISLYSNTDTSEFKIDLADDQVEIDVPERASYDRSWLFSKKQIAEDIFDNTEINTVRFVEEYNKEEIETDEGEIGDIEDIREEIENKEEENEDEEIEKEE